MKHRFLLFVPDGAGRGYGTPVTRRLRSTKWAANSLEVPRLESSSPIVGLATAPLHWRPQHGLSTWSGHTMPLGADPTLARRFALDIDGDVPNQARSR